MRVGVFSLDNLLGVVVATHMEGLFIMEAVAGVKAEPVVKTNKLQALVLGLQHVLAMYSGAVVNWGSTAFYTTANGVLNFGGYLYDRNWHIATAKEYTPHWYRNAGCVGFGNSVGVSFD